MARLKCWTRYDQVGLTLLNGERVVGRVESGRGYVFRVEGGKTYRLFSGGPFRVAGKRSQTDGDGQIRIPELRIELRRYRGNSFSRGIPKGKPSAFEYPSFEN